MSGRPLGTRTQFATDVNYTAGPFIGQPTKLPLLSGEKAQGLVPSQRPAAEKLNQLLNEHAKWVDYIVDAPLLNWYPPLAADLTLTGFDTTYTREQNGVGNLNLVSDIFWSTVHKRWILCGSNTAGSFYVADQNVAQKIASGATSPPKLAFGCESNDRVLLFTGTNRGTGQTIDYVRSPSGTLTGTWVKASLPGTVAGNAHAGCALFVNGLIPGGYTTFVFGGRDTNHKLWYSFDDGASFAEQNIGASTGTAYIDRAVIGAIHTGGTRRIIGITNASTANGGKKVWYSDGGIAGTWNNITFSDDGISNIVYDDTSKLYFIVAGQGSKLYVSSDPIGGSLQTLFSGTPGSFPAITAANVFGDTVVFAMAMSATESRIWMIPTPAAGIKECHRVWAAFATSDTALPACIGVSEVGQFAMHVPGLIVQLSQKAFGA